MGEEGSEGRNEREEEKRKFNEVQDSGIILENRRWKEKIKMQTRPSRAIIRKGRKKN